ncbi:uncharacterized protein LOC107883765 [Acyrthosiphon pisum]|uniref:Peptidase aspartic putative domain-containing protein n=1 Tax=Acyrthosiphon pisum TaxID=7029 RepID=A0A8R2H6P3_ACYPI|nr:uncharacterized protein LOC107883765 [Acyrthosiphon pisum]|eukprot:XP_016659921.1 PREDICTED: uncharacterized protein LOC107883765 [Acyrthosiphon pisum]
MLRRFHSSVSVTTFPSSASTVNRGKCNIKIAPSGQQSPSFCLDVSIVPQITGQTPQTPITSGHWAHMTDLFPSVLLYDTQKDQPGEPLALNTVFGWVLMGPTEFYDGSSVTTLCLTVSDPIDSLIKKFWELEELPTTFHLSTADTAAEEIYNSTTTQLSSGRFVVTLPFLKPRPLLGDSKTLALQRFKALECRLTRNKI